MFSIAWKQTLINLDLENKLKYNSWRDVLHDKDLLEENWTEVVCLQGQKSAAPETQQQHASEADSFKLRMKLMLN